MSLLRIVSVGLAVMSAACSGPSKVCEPQQERCNGGDDDCDGLIDEGFDVGSGCAVGTGACRVAGALACTDAGAVACAASAGQPVAESCNGVDDDCDGETDEGIVGCCTPGATTPCGVDEGACVAGVQTCSLQRAFGACEVNGQPARLPGSVSESCNGLDDDCDGETDEGFSIGAACTRGVGACAASGVSRCDANGQTVSCDAVEGPPAPESCNGVDDDCDGQVDEEVAGCCAPGATQACGADLGVCLAGTQTCTAARAFGPCVDAGGQPVPLPGAGVEACNGVDDDCDGQTDESFALGVACDGPGDDACAEGTTVCAADGQSAVCLETAPNRIERCNGVDDDCDGQTDESFPGEGEPCTLAGGSCLVGVKTCAGGVVTCVAGPGGGLDCCGNFIDDDGDGATDEDVLPERCNGVDDDCDGETDEPEGLQPCVAHEVSAATCTAGVCVVTTCAPGFFDHNQQFDDGCESTVP